MLNRSVIQKERRTAVHEWQWRIRVMVYSDTKYYYLSGMPERYGTVNEKFPEVEHLGCRMDVNKILEDGKTDELSLDDIVDAIDKFYSDRKNLVILIVYAYCYSINNFAGVSKEELNSYREKLLAFSKD